MVTNLSLQSSLVNQFISEMRDVNKQQDRLRFRINIERLGEILAYEISRKLSYENKLVTTPLGKIEVPVLKQQPVVGTILRAGLPLHQGILNFFDQADNAFMSAYRKHKADGGFDIELGYLASADMNGRPLIIADPMLATGRSMVETLKLVLKQFTPSEIHIACIIASDEGIRYAKEFLPNAHIWAATIDRELNADAYIVPGLGDAGDLAFGDKMQH